MGTDAGLILSCSMSKLAITPWYLWYSTSHSLTRLQKLAVHTSGLDMQGAAFKPIEGSSITVKTLLNLHATAQCLQAQALSGRSKPN